MSSLKVRSIIPVCAKDEVVNGYYCKRGFPDSLATRKEILKKSMEYGQDNIDLIVTSNNFFTFFPSCQMSGRQLTESYIVRELEDLCLKKPLIVGFDLINRHIHFNPYSGIDAIVCFLKVNNYNMYEYATHVWECWTSKSCDQIGFIEQNDKRTIDFKGQTVCLLSCGDILGSCHDSGKNLPNANVYVSLAHMNFKKLILSIKERDQDGANIQKWKNSYDIKVLVTQQITREILIHMNNNYFKKNNELEYQLIWPPMIRKNQRLSLFDINSNKVRKKEDAEYIFVDIIIS